MNKMTIKDFCDTILFSESLDDKLSYPEKSEFSNFKPLNKSPDSPGRPESLLFNTGKSMKLPSIHTLEENRHRGILMHFFLNHELLALEIMALTLLKFPDLPDSFKRSLLNTMREEQEHARLYINRMTELGVEMGDVYVNSFFWDCLKNMKTPVDFVRTMSLTFEQANLDFSLFYKKAFETCGDFKTATIMDKVYRDEIGHVSAGLKWFRKWKESKISDWDAYVSGLEIPLSPSRAKGQLYDRDGRNKAGFTDDFIDRLEVSSFSRGRAPNVYIFNAFTESFIAQPNGFNRPDWGIQLEEDLSILPLVFAGHDDILYSYRNFSVEHLHKLKNMGLELPQIEVIKPGESIKALKKRTPGKLKPWGWSPEINRALKNLIKQRKPETLWEERFKGLFSKQWSMEFNNSINNSLLSWGEDNSALGKFCATIDEVNDQFNYLTENSWKVICIKSPFGASGRNIMRFPMGDMTENQQGRVKNLIKKQGGVIVEPWLKREADFSIHFDMKDKLKFTGITRLLNDEHGQYSGSVFGRFENGLSVEVLKCLHQKSKGGLTDYFKELMPQIEEKISLFNYKGPIGIDSFIYRNLNDELQFRPVVEINFRYTMGRVALELEKKLKRGKCGLFKIYSILSDRERELAVNLVKYKNEKPEIDEYGKWVAGKCLLNEWHDRIKFPVTISIGNNLDECYLDG